MPQTIHMCDDSSCDEKEFALFFTKHKAILTWTMQYSKIMKTLAGCDSEDFSRLFSPSWNITFRCSFILDLVSKYRVERWKICFDTLLREHLRKYHLPRKDWIQFDNCSESKVALLCLNCCRTWLLASNHTWDCPNPGPPMCGYWTLPSILVTWFIQNNYMFGFLSYMGDHSHMYEVDIGFLVVICFVSLLCLFLLIHYIWGLKLFAYTQGGLGLQEMVGATSEHRCKVHFRAVSL